jgi:hypothetical protein
MVVNPRNQKWQVLYLDIRPAILLRVGLHPAQIDWTPTGLVAALLYFTFIRSSSKMIYRISLW